MMFINQEAVLFLTLEYFALSVKETTGKALDLNAIDVMTGEYI